MTLSLDDTGELLAAAGLWAHHDPDPETRRALERLIAGGKLDELALCMKPLVFGTAGLRGVEGPGPGRMNLAVVLRTARGLAEYLLERAASAGDGAEQTLKDRAGDRKPPLVVLGYDARKNSRRYAEAAIGVFVAAGLRVRFFKDPVPTPLVAYAANVEGADAALVVTASHNPAEYAGLKLYGSNAVQLVEPVDARIAAAIASVGPAAAILREDASRSPNALEFGPELSERYYAEVLGHRLNPSQASPLGIVYTPLHGVGGQHMLEILKRAGYKNVAVVREQFAPDPEFPTLGFPNPEEPGTLERALALASARRADLVLANDPDADRLAVAVPLETGEFCALTGNQVGLLLADYLLNHYQGRARPLLVSSIVSSPMLSRIAKAHGAEAVRTLTGFKWMLNAALRIEAEAGLCFVFGFEEALGYAVGGSVRDKDGLSAALLFADLVEETRQSGHQIWDALRGLYSAHGLWASALFNLSFAADASELERVRAGVRSLRANPPARLAESKVEKVTDYAEHADRRPWYLGSSDLLEFELEAGARVLLRPSGTEPKLKIYADFVQPYLASVSLTEQERAAEARARHLAECLGKLVLGHH